MKLHIYTLALLFSAQITYAQTNIYKHFGVDEGLPSSEVYDVYQDKEGYVWFATDKGLSRYNGYEFENFTTKDGLPDNTILGFYPQKNGQIWCYGYHSKRLFYFNEVFDGFKEYKYNSILVKKLSSSAVLKSIVIDDNNTLYTGGNGYAGLLIITDNGKITSELNLNTYSKQLQKDFNTRIGYHNKSGAYFAIYHNYQSEKNFSIYNTDYSIGSRIRFSVINDSISIFIDRKLGIISNNTLIKYYETKQNPIGIKKIDDTSFFVGYYGNGAEVRDTSGNILKTFLPKKSVSNFLIDAEGSYWYTTLNDGVFYNKNPKIQVASKEHIVTLVKNEKNNLFAGFDNGNIAQVTKNKISKLYHGLNDNKAVVEFDKKNNYLYGYSDGALVNYTDTKKTFKLIANKLVEHIGNNALIGSNTNGWITIKDNFVKTQVIGCKVQDACVYKNNILIGTSTGLFIQKDTITSPQQSLDILKNRIDDIDLNTRTNTVYMATQGAGVIVYGDSIYNVAKKDGLTNNIIGEVHIENDSVIWACSNTGLNRIQFNLNKPTSVTQFTKADGLLSNDINDIEIINDTIWVATKKGLCYFNKGIISNKKNLKTISLSLEKITVNGININKKSTKLKYNENSIDFKLLAISHKNTPKINYLYRLKEIDTTWIKTQNRNISFASLSAGKYTFEAKVAIDNNVNKHLVTYSFVIQPPFWNSWWFYGICSLFLLSIIYLFFKIRVFSYNKNITRELIRLSIKSLKRKEQFYKFRSNGEDFKIPAREIQYVNSQGNYLDIVTNKRTYTIRCKISGFLNTVSDTLEFLRVHRSYIVRIDQISSKGKNWVVIKDKKIPVGETYLNALNNIQF